MLNTNVNVAGTTLNFNAVSGTLIKSCEKSKFTRFHMQSDRAATYFASKPHRTYYGREIPITVLQVMLCGDKEFLVEYIDNEDLEEKED